MSIVLLRNHVGKEHNMVKANNSCSHQEAERFVLSFVPFDVMCVCVTDGGRRTAAVTAHVRKIPGVSSDK